MGDPGGPEERPLEEIAGFQETGDPSLPGRVTRSINRRLFAGDTLDFGLGAMISAAWHFFLVMIEALGPKQSSPEDDSDER